MRSEREYLKIIFIIGGFLCYLIADGCTFSIGILYNEFLNSFDESKVLTAVLPGLIYAVPQLLGSFICPLVDIVGSGYCAIIGGFILSFSFFVSRFVSSFLFMYLTLGFFASIGLELIYVSGIMAVTKGFAKGKYLGLALGITVSGSGIGLFIFNPLLNYLITEFTWKGAIIIESAIFLNVIVAGALFLYGSGIHKLPKKGKQKVHIQIVQDQRNYHSIVRQISHSHSAEALDTVSNQPPYSLRDRRSSVMLTKTQTQNCEPFYRPVNTQSKASSLDRRLKPIECSVQLPVDERSASFVNRLSQYGSQNIRGSSQNIKGSRKMSQETLSSQPSLTIDTTEDVSRTDNTYTQSGADIQLIPIQTDKPLSICGRFFKDLKKSMLSIFSVKVWSNKNLLLFYVITLLFAISVVLVWTFTFDHFVNVGVPRMQASLLVSFVGAGSCFGQIFFGYISDYIRAISLYGFGCLIAGMVTLFLRYVTTYWWLSILHILFGFSQGVSYALFSVILVHYASVELYPASLAIYLLFSGSGNLIGTTLTGYLNDVYGDYGVAFTVSGSLLVVSAVLAVPLIRVWDSHNRN